MDRRSRTELIAIVGFSGSGKTTLISLIAGLIGPDSGPVLKNGVGFEPTTKGL
jgi:ABC-type sugar transport system ATPase subunit